MSQSKIEFRLGDMHFVGEGETVWVTKQLDKIISTVPSLRNATGTMEEEMPSSPRVATVSKVVKKRKPYKKRAKNNSKKTTVKTATPKVTGVKSTSSGNDLAAFIKSNKAASNQRMKFLAAAVWLNKNGNPNMVTRDITKALKTSRVPALINPSQYLNQNVKQGYLKKSGDHFILTKKGTAAL